MFVSGCRAMDNQARLLALTRILPGLPEALPRAQGRFITDT